MPLYEYECTNCQAVHEKFRKLPSKDEPINCPICGSIALRKPSVVQLRAGGPCRMTPVEEATKERIRKSAVADWWRYKESKKRS